MQFIINGGKKLEGTIAVAGSKNAASPIIAATLLTRAPCVLSNVPRIGDVFTMLALLTSIGSRQRWLSDHTIEIINDDIDPARLDQRLVAHIRSSIMLVGPLLARFGEATFVAPGGCHIGTRPIDTHLEAFRSLGAEVAFDAGSGRYRIRLARPTAAAVTLREFSVTATENVLLYAANHPCTIKLAATEPHVADVGAFLKRLGARIRGLGTHTITVSAPVSARAGAVRHRVVNDAIEMGTFAVLAATTRGKVRITGVVSDHMEAALAKFSEMGVVWELRGKDLFINGPASALKAAKIEARPYPGLPTDLQSPFGVLATQADGASLIFDTLFEGRLRYVDELKKMGAEATVLDPHRAIIKGPSVLHGTQVAGLDLRAGATLLIAGLVAKGVTTIEEAQQIDRGYEAIDERLRALGADIRRKI